MGRMLGDSLVKNASGACVTSMITAIHIAVLSREECAWRRGITDAQHMARRQVRQIDALPFRPLRANKMRFGSCSGQYICVGNILLLRCLWCRSGSRKFGEMSGQSSRTSTGVHPLCAVAETESSPRAEVIAFDARLPPFASTTTTRDPCVRALCRYGLIGRTHLLRLVQYVTSTTRSHQYDKGRTDMWHANLLYKRRTVDTVNSPIGLNRCGITVSPAPRSRYMTSSARRAGRNKTSMRALKPR